MAGSSTTIKGVTVTIGADTKEFINGLKKVDKEIRYSEREVNELKKQLAIKYDEATWEKASSMVQNDLKATEEKAAAIKKQLDEISKTQGVDSQAIQLKNSLDDLDKIKSPSFLDKVKDFASNLSTATVATVAAGKAIYDVGKKAISTGDEIQTLADKYNLSAEAIQRWNYIALQSDVSSDQLYKSMTKVRDAVGTAMLGETNSATEAIEALVGDISKVPTDTEGAFSTIIAALSNVEDKTMQAYYANEIFGEKTATDLIPLLNKGADGLNQLSAEFESVGYLSNEDVEQLSKFDNVINRITSKIENLVSKLGVALMPLLQVFADLLEDVIVPALELVMEFLQPIIDAISWI